MLLQEHKSVLLQKRKSVLLQEHKSVLLQERKSVLLHEREDALVTTRVQGKTQELQANFIGGSDKKRNQTAEHIEHCPSTKSKRPDEKITLVFFTHVVFALKKRNKARMICQKDGRDQAGKVLCNLKHLRLALETMRQEADEKDRHGCCKVYGKAIAFDGDHYLLCIFGYILQQADPHANLSSTLALKFLSETFELNVDVQVLHIYFTKCPSTSKIFLNTLTYLWNTTWKYVEELKMDVKANYLRALAHLFWNLSSGL